MRRIGLGGLVLLLALGLTGCASGRSPAFYQQQSVGSSVVLLDPEIRAGRTASPADREALADGLRTEVRHALVASGVAVQATEPGRFDRLRAGVVDAWLSGRARGFGRLKAGQVLDLGDLLDEARSAGARTLILPAMVRTGQPVRDGEYVPRAPGEVLRLPEDRPDYVIPKAGRDAFPAGVDLDLLVIDVATSKVLAHRVSSMPAQTVADILDVLPRLVANDTRNLTP